MLEKERVLKALKRGIREVTDELLLSEIHKMNRYLLNYWDLRIPDNEIILSIIKFGEANKITNPDIDDEEMTQKVSDSTRNTCIEYLEQLDQLEEE